MASRRDVREAFYNELETATAGLLDASAIGQEYPNSTEQMPAVVHNDNYRKVPMNRGAAPTDVTTDTDGEQTYHYTTLIQAQFSVLVISDDEDEKEDIYEAIRSYFEEFTHPVRDTSDIQSDVHRVEVQDANSEDTEDRDPPARGDRLTINLDFTRTYDRDVDPTDTVQQNVDGGTDDITYTTT